MPRSHPSPFARPLLLVLLAALLATAQGSDLGLSPPRLELVARPGETLTETVTVVVSGAADQRVAVEPVDWTMDLSGSLLVLPPGQLATSATGWLVPESDELDVAGGSAQEFRFEVQVPDDPTLAGTYQGMLFFTVIPPDAATSGVGLTTTTRIGLTIYLTIAGTEEGGSELIDLYPSDAGALTAAVANLGNTVMRLGGVVELRDEAGQTRYRIEVPDVPVLRDSDRDVVLPLPAEIEPGFYLALALIEDSRGGLLVGEVPLEIE